MNPGAVVPRRFARFEVLPAPPDAPHAEIPCDAGDLRRADLFEKSFFRGGLTKYFSCAIISATPEQMFVSRPKRRERFSHTAASGFISERERTYVRNEGSAKDNTGRKDVRLVFRPHDVRQTIVRRRGLRASDLVREGEPSP